MSPMTADLARALLDYAPATGRLTCKVQRRKAFAGAEAGWLSREGYRVLTVDHKTYKAHRVAWLMMTGEWPAQEIDHANGVRNDNRWLNLRLATKGQNNANARTYRNNKLGLKGVHWHQRARKYVASIRIDYKLRYLGSFDDPSAAHAAYVAAAVATRGEFARAA